MEFVVRDREAFKLAGRFADNYTSILIHRLVWNKGFFCSCDTGLNPGYTVEL